MPIDAVSSQTLSTEAVGKPLLIKKEGRLFMYVLHCNVLLKVVCNFKPSKLKVVSLSTR